MSLVAWLGVRYAIGGRLLVAALSIAWWRELRRLVTVIYRFLVVRFRRPWRNPGQHSPLELLLTVLSSSIVLLTFIEAVAPEIQFDSLNYHLATINFFLQQHRLGFTPFNFH